MDRLNLLKASKKGIGSIDVAEWRKYADAVGEGSMDENELDDFFCQHISLEKPEMLEFDSREYEIEQLQSAISDLLEARLYPENYSDLG